MHLPAIELHECDTLDGASEKLARYGARARLLAGGTDLLVDLKSGRASCDHLVSLRRIDSLQGLRFSNGRLRIGSRTTITQLDRSRLLDERFSAIGDATGKMAAVQIRNVATVGGNIASAVPCADLPPILTAMNASVLLWSPEGERTVPLDGFFTGARATIRRSCEILTAVIVPVPPPGFGAAYARFGLRDGNTIAVAAVAASLLLGPDDTVRDARIVLGAVAPIPKLVESAGAVLVGRRPAPELFHEAAVLAMRAAEPISDVRGSADYRRELVGVLTQRALETSWKRAEAMQGRGAREQAADE